MEETAQFFQYKMYFILKLAPFLTNSELDRILATIHKRVVSDDVEK